MRFAITAFDLYGNIFQTLVDEGWTPVKLFTWPVDHFYDENSGVIEMARRLRIPTQISRMQEEDLRDLADRGCDILIGAGYRWRIGDWSQHLRYAVNFHPSPLPIGRGPFPAVRAITDGYREWAYTAHKFAPDFDTGDMLASEAFPLAENERQETLTLRIRMAGERLARKVARELPDLWDNATPQTGGEYFHRWTEAERTLDFTKTVAENLRMARAFGQIEVIAVVGEAKVYVRDVAGWQETHAHKPGTIVHTHGRHTVISVSDGYLALLAWSAIEAYRARHMGR